MQAELKSKNEGARLGPNTMSGAPQHFPLQRSVINRPDLPNRTITVPLPKISVQTQSPAGIGAKQSPRASRAQTLSPTTNKSPVSAGHRRMTSSGADLRGPLPSQFRNRNHPRRHSGVVSKTSVPPMQILRPSTRDGSRSSDTGSTSGAHSNYYASPFQTHIEQLGKLLRPLLSGSDEKSLGIRNLTWHVEQEYDAHSDMLDDQDPGEQPPGPGPYPQTFHHQPSQPGQQHPMSLQRDSSIQSMHTMRPPTTSRDIDPSHPAYHPTNQLFDHYDPMLDADPFGLSASMHFPTQFTFQESSMRH